MTQLWDNPRPQGYWPGTPNQFREATVDDCTWYATEFGFEAASETHRSVHPVKSLRKFSTDRVGGTPVAVAIRDTQDLWPEQEQVVSVYERFTRKRIITLLKRGATIIYGGDYEKLPPHYRRWTNNDKFDHACATRTLDLNNNGDERTFLYDPLGGGPTFQPYDGEWITIDNILKYCWRTGNASYWVGIIENKGDEPMKTVNLNPNQPTDSEVRVGKNTAVRVAPRTTAINKRIIWDANKWWAFIGKAGSGWRLIGWNLEESRKNIGYVHVNDIREIRKVAPLVTNVDVKTLMETNNVLQRQITQLSDDNTDLNHILKEYTDIIPHVRDELATLP